MKTVQYKVPSFWRSLLILFFAIISLAGAISLRLLSGFDEDDQLDRIAQAQIEKANKDEAAYTVIKNIESIGDLKNQVKPIVFDDVVIEQRNQDESFQDIEYIAERKKAWTVQIMDVSQLEIILDYLATQKKRSQFAYFRYSDKNKEKRYILTFDDFNSESGAVSAIESNEFKLPASIKPFPRAFKDYLGLVEQYHLENKVREYKRSKYREVHLKKTRAPVVFKKEVITTYTNKPKNKSFDRKPDNNAFANQSTNAGRYVQPQSNKENTKTTNKIESNKKEVKNNNPNEDVIESLINGIQ